MTNFFFSELFEIFSVQNLGNYRAKKITFGSVGSKMNEKQAATFALFFYIFELPKGHLICGVSMNLGVNIPSDTGSALLS